MKGIHADTMYYFHQGLCEDAYHHFGAHLIKDKKGQVTLTRFTVYAPSAKAVSLIGEFNHFEDWTHQMTKVDEAGVFQIEIPGSLEWATYKYKIFPHHGDPLYKADPYAFYASHRPETTSKVYDLDGYQWSDHAYMKNRHEHRPYDQPVMIYELHAGSWMNKPGNQSHTFAELVDLLIPYLKKHHYTHVEFMPIYEHPFDASWGYQGTGYYAVTSRYGVPKDFMYLVDRCHQENISVILDWVPGHMCKDAHGLYMFDGSPLYEYQDPVIRENIVWGTANFDLGRGEVRSFMISNALFYMREFHVDGFRLDAVSNMIFYLGDPSIGENHGAQAFLKELSKVIFKENPAAILAAEDSSAHPKITHPVEFGGLGFNYKWNMGWMNDTLKYFEKDPVHRKYHHHQLVFSMHYAYAENYILPLSHDEVVHGKKSLIDKMPGDYWQKFANLRAYMGYFYTHPGKTLMFMGGEFGQFREWSEERELDWFLLEHPMHQNLEHFHQTFKKIKTEEEALFSLDHVPEGFEWIDQYNADQSILSFVRKGQNGDHILVVLNLTPVTYHDYQIGVPLAGTYDEILNSDRSEFGGSNLYNGTPLKTSKDSSHGREDSIRLLISPLSVTLLKWRRP